jgi:hypothetical protein
MAKFQVKSGQKTKYSSFPYEKKRPAALFTYCLDIFCIPFAARPITGYGRTKSGRAIPEY